MSSSSALVDHYTYKLDRLDVGWSNNYSIMAFIQDDFWPAIFHDDASIDYAYSVESRSARIASCFLELEKMNQDLESKLRNDFHSILNSMDRLSLSPTLHSPSPPPNPLARTTSSIHNSFTIAAYSWLLENVTNPYPSSVVKTSLAQRHNYSLSAVNSWFVNARRRMGWTALCRDYFNNCRADALDAAHRALINEDPNRPLSPDVIHAFVRVKVAAEDLYSSTFTKSALAGDLDAVVRDMTDQDATPVGGQKHREPEEVVDPPEASEVELQNKAQYYYLSSDYSSSSSPVPPLDQSLTDDSEEEEEISPPVLAGRKRRLSCSESAYSAALPTKRRRNLRYARLLFNFSFPNLPIHSFPASLPQSRLAHRPQRNLWNMVKNRAPGQFLRLLRASPLHANDVCLIQTPLECQNIRRG